MSFDKKAYMAKCREKYAVQREQCAAKAVEWNRANKDRRAVIAAKYSAANPDQCRATKARRRARLNDAVGSYTKLDVRDVLERQRWLCAACRESLTPGYEVDHIQALSRGGANDKTNIQGLCRRCNRRKGANDNAAFLQEIQGAVP